MVPVGTMENYEKVKREYEIKIYMLEWVLGVIR